MSDDDLRKAYERGLPRGGERPPLDDIAAERLRKLVEREGSEEDRLHALNSLLSTAEGRRELDIVWAAARAARPRRRRSGAWLVAASVLLAAGVAGTWLSRPAEQELRGNDSPITLLSPRGEASGTPRFVWRPFPDAARYALVVVDSAGNDVFTTETLDTVVTLPDSVRLRAGVEYHWWVEATTPSGGKATAFTQSLRVKGQR